MELLACFFFFTPLRLFFSSNASRVCGRVAIMCLDKHDTGECSGLYTLFERELNCFFGPVFIIVKSIAPAFVGLVAA